MAQSSPAVSPQDLAAGYAALAAAYAQAAAEEEAEGEVPLAEGDVDGFFEFFLWGGGGKEKICTKQQMAARCVVGYRKFRFRTRKLEWMISDDIGWVG